MSQHGPECDLVLYGSVPGAKGVVCTCDHDDEVMSDAPAAPSSPALGRSDPTTPIVTLTGDKAVKFERYRKAAAAAKAAQEVAARAGEEYRAALDDFTTSVMP
jgi:hypothetical protein